MAKQDKAAYGSYASDTFDNPPIGPVGVHRGPRSVWARMVPYVVVLVIAMLAGILAWGLVTGEFAKFFEGGSTTSQSSDGSSSDKTDKTDKTTDKTDKSQSDESGKSDTSDGQNTDGATDGQNNSDAADTTGTDAADSDTAATDDSQATQTSEPNKGTSVRVVNATSIAGYAAQEAGVLSGAGYTSVEAANPTGSSLPANTVVWYQNEADAATAQDVASTLGIADVQQTTGLDVPIVVVLMQ